MEASTAEERYVRLTQLPEEIEFPRELKDRIFYDVDGKRLVFRGYMSRADRTRLAGLSNDIYYHQALERLCMGNPSRVSWTAVFVGIIVLGCLVLAGIRRLKG